MAPPFSRFPLPGWRVRVTAMRDDDVTIASVAFDGDYRMVVLQALSIDRLLDLSGVREYLIVANSPELKPEIQRLLSRVLSAELRSRLRIMEPADLGQAGTETMVWRGQQVLKLALASAVKTGYYLMLDAKNHFIRPTALGEFFAADAQPITQIGPISAYWQTYLDASLDALGVVDRPAVMMPSITPYLFITAEVRELVERLEKRYEAPLALAMTRTKRATEFLLYYAHLIDKGDLPYVDAPPLCTTLFTVWPPADRVLEFVGQDRAMFGLHRTRIPQLTAEQRAAVTAMWRRHLLADWEDAGWFLYTGLPVST